MTIDPLDLPLTKRDALQGFSTKKDLKRFATKEDLKKFATKKELHEMENRLEEKIDIKIGERLSTSQDAFRREIHFEFTCMREDLQKQLSEFTKRILTAIDPLLKELETRQQDREIAVEWHRNHEERISKLERQAKTKHN